MKTAVVYFSSTGNTEDMANAVLEGMKSKGAEAELFTSADFTADQVDNFDAIAFGCPAMGDEVLEEDELAPMFLPLSLASQASNMGANSSSSRTSSPIAGQPNAIASKLST